MHTVRAEVFISEQGAEVQSRMFAGGKCYIKCYSPEGYEFFVRVTSDNEITYKDVRVREVIVSKTEGDKEFVMGEREIVSYEMFAAVYDRALQEADTEVMLVCSNGFCVLEEGKSSSYIRESDPDCKISICPSSFPVVDMCDYMKSPEEIHTRVRQIHMCLHREEMRLVEIEEGRMHKAVKCLESNFARYMAECYSAIQRLGEEISYLCEMLEHLRERECNAICTSDVKEIRCEIRKTLRQLREKRQCMKEYLCSKIPKALSLRHTVDHAISELHTC